MALPHYDAAKAGAVYPFEPDGSPARNNDLVFTQDQLHKLLVRELKLLGVEPQQYVFTVNGEPSGHIAVRAVVDGRAYNPKELLPAFTYLRDRAEEVFEYPEMHADTDDYVQEQLTRMAAAGVDITNKDFVEVLLTDDDHLAMQYEANCPYYKELRQGLWCWEEGEHADEVIHGQRYR
jgi:hypothetical protein